MAMWLWHACNHSTSSCNSCKDFLSILDQQTKEDLKHYTIESNSYELSNSQEYPWLQDRSSQVEKIDISIYTDGSLHSDGVGAAFILYNHRNNSNHRSAYKLGPHCSVPQAEILAITKAMEHIHEEWFPQQLNICVYTDSLTALHSIYTPFKRGKNVTKIHRLLSANTHRHTVYFKWVRGHSGVPGNEAADQLAKQAASSTLGYDYSKILISKIRLWAFNQALSLWQKEWDNGATGRTTHRFIPNISERLKWKFFTPNYRLTQLITAHGNFNVYLKRFHIKTIDTCSCDNTSPEDTDHLIWDCKLYAQQRIILMGHVLKSNYSWPCPHNRLLQDQDILNAVNTFLKTTAALDPPHVQHQTNNN
ncbi:uncharacterized protein [Centruroides vittatus]|uniref:uncharacterized protein n=1 Tax=Centruroides vittatus TaxID=120091 RepID=UPI00350F7D8C